MKSVSSPTKSLNLNISTNTNNTVGEEDESTKHIDTSIIQMLLVDFDSGAPTIQP